ncbi:anoctamin-4 isoform X2 [Patella vulgata]|uniref:anoctamin-4 isoform X2 n=1 Tax=Patella vulgata TaxID=6465 RepID=UPI0024A9B38A|nr:anoctamin-4 isoform X2 [Patella vulgata]
MDSTESSTMDNDLHDLIEESEHESDGEGNLSRSFKGTSQAVNAVTKLHKRKKHKHKKKDKGPKMTPFERRYSTLAIKNELIPERKRIDFVLIHPNTNPSVEKGKTKPKTLQHIQNRELFEDNLRDEGFSIQETEIGNLIYKKLHCPFKRLCVEAERVKLEMPLKDCDIPDTDNYGCIGRFIERHFDTDNEVDYVSSQFYMDSIDMYQHHTDPSNFFRPALRSALVYHILINMDIRTETEKLEGSNPDEDDPQSKFDTVMNYLSPQESQNAATESSNRKVLKKKGLLYLLMKKSYTDCMILHENSQSRKKLEEGIDEHFDVSDDDGSQVSVKIDEDPRKDLDETWTKFFKFQPLWKIRNYFGEQIAFYFAWSGMLIMSLWLPSLLGIGIFIYGLVVSASKESSDTDQSDNVTSSTIDNIKNTVVGVLDLVKESFDNDATPFFGLIICLWGTIFLEAWKRKTATLAYEWDVEDFESKEPDRPQFYGTKVKPDPVTQEQMQFYPFKRQFLKITASSSVLLFMMLLVVISVTSVIIYRVIVNVDYCPNISSTECLLLTTVISSIFNAVSILILGKVYDKLAVFLTEWENHRTQTSYDDSLIIKLFAFQFVNSYASCFYIAFFRGRFDSVLVEGDQYKDFCSGTCMSQLSFQVLVLMLMKPFPKLLKDIILPFVRRMFTKFFPSCNGCGCCPCCGKNKVDEGPKVTLGNGRVPHTEFLERERKKPGLGDFTLGEYTEKVIQYGFLMLFAVSFPLAPILALVTNLVDIRVDAKRMLWWYRRPIAFIAQDIGMWYDILYFVNIIGVLTNAFLIAFTSNWGGKYTMEEKLWIVIGFEHIVFALKYVLAAMIPDVPTDVKLAIRREKYQISKKLEESKSTKMNYTQLYPGSSSVCETTSPQDANFMSGSAPGTPMKHSTGTQEVNESYQPTDPLKEPCNEIRSVSSIDTHGGRQLNQQTLHNKQINSSSGDHEFTHPPPNPHLPVHIDDNRYNNQSHV